MKTEDLLLQKLEQAYKGADTALTFSDTFQLLVAVILSAQCTDVRVNIVTEKLFRDYPTVTDVNKMDEATLIEYIKSCGLFKNKAKNIKLTAKALVENFGGVVPSTREELMSLPGVGRKTANVVMAVGFGKPAIAVDTHVFRVSNRMGLANATTPEGVEEQLCSKITMEKWGQAHHWLIHHGREVCHSQKPACRTCPVQDCCKYYAEKNNG